MTEASIALNRFGLGARPDEAPPADGRRWLIEQFGRFDPRPAPIAGATSSAVAAATIADYQQAARSMRRAAGPPAAAETAPPVMAPATPGQAMTAPPQTARGAAGEAIADARQAARRIATQQYAGGAVARATAALTTPAPFVERLVHFWANHFAVSADKLTVIGLAPAFEFEAIRPHVLGRFGDMLNAVEHHPAMLLYLDQAQSVGPGSVVGARAAAGGAAGSGSTRTSRARSSNFIRSGSALAIRRPMSPSSRAR